MGLLITNPQDAYALRNTNVSWQEPGGQTAYELMYKLKSDSSWNTLGVVNSSNAYASLSGIYDKVENSGYAFNEIHYRVKVYTKTTSGNETTNGEWYSRAYNLIFKPETKATLKARKGEDTINIPLFEKAVLATGKKLNANPDGMRELSAPLVREDHPLKSGVKVEALGEVLDAASDTPQFGATGIHGSAYMTVTGSYYGYTDATGYSTGYYNHNYVVGPEYDQAWDSYYYIGYFYYVYSGAAYNYYSQYTYTTHTGYYYYTRTGYYLVSGFSAGYLPVWTTGYYLRSWGYYYRNMSYVVPYSYSYKYYYGMNKTYGYNYYMAG